MKPQPFRRSLPALLSRLPERFRWTPHNLLAHPLSELLYQVGLRKASDWVHDATIPLYSSEPRG